MATWILEKAEPQFNGGESKTEPKHINNDKVKNTDFSLEVYQHFGLDLLEMREKGQEHEWGICKREEAGRCTRNMLGFGMEQSQQVIIDYDKDYDWVLIRRVKRKCGDVDTPQRNQKHFNSCSSGQGVIEHISEYLHWDLFISEPMDSMMAGSAV